MRELLEAVAVKNGFKIYNHECYAPFLKEILHESEYGDEFDEIRKVRNGINYYGKKISVEDARKILGRITSLRNFCLDALNRHDESQDDTGLSSKN